MNCPQDLRKRYHEGRVIPFIGAGVSMSVKWARDGESRRGPSWAELVDQATRLLGFTDPELARARGSDLQILEYFKRKHGQQTAKLTNWLSKLMDPRDEDLRQSAIHRELAALHKCTLFYTTNFDNFLERSFALHGRCHSTIVLESQMGGQRSDCEIIKFHGDLDHPDQIVLTESDFEKRLALSTALDQRLRADLLGRVILFIGYSFRDPNVSYLFRLFTDHFYDKTGTLTGNRAYIIVANPSDFEEQLFNARRINVIGVDGASMTDDLAALLAEMRG